MSGNGLEATNRSIFHIGERTVAGQTEPARLDA